MFSLLSLVLSKYRRNNDRLVFCCMSTKRSNYCCCSLMVFSIYIYIPTCGESLMTAPLLLWKRFYVSIFNNMNSSIAKCRFFIFTLYFYSEGGVISKSFVTFEMKLGIFYFYSFD